MIKFNLKNKYFKKEYENYIFRWGVLKTDIKHQCRLFRNYILRKIKGPYPIIIGEHICPLCGKSLGNIVDYSLLEDPGEAASKGMGDYYGRRQHYEQEHDMTDQEARPYAL